MKRTYRLNLIRAKRSYSVKDASDLLETHVRTVQGWIKDGLKVLEGSRPYLMMGHDLKAFLTEKTRKRKRPLAEGEFYCFRCKAVVTAVQVERVETGKVMGHGQVGVALKGACAACGGKVNRFSALPKGAVSATDPQAGAV